MGVTPGRTEAVPLDLSFHHEAFFYAGDAELVTMATRFIEDAQAAGEPVMVAVSGRIIDRLRANLGGEPPGVFLVDMPTLGQNPARIIPAWRRFVDEQGPDAPGLRGIGEPIWAGRGSAELVECRQHEALLNLAFGGAPSGGPRPGAGAAGGDGTPFWLLCPYDAAALDSRVVEEAHGTHPFLRNNGTAAHSHHYHGVDPALLLDEPLPEPRAQPAELVFDHMLTRLRRFVAEQVERITPDILRRRPLLDVVLAVEELGSNSVRHGGGHGVARIWREDDTLLCEVRDRGHITDPLVGRYEPDDRQIGGRGLWMVNQLCDLVQIRSSSSGTTIRIHFRITP